MREKLEQRLATLREEHESGQKMLADLDQKRQGLVQTLLRIEGAMQVLTEMIDQEKGGSAPATGPGATS